MSEFCSYWQDLGWDCYLSVFENLYQNYGPWLMSDLVSAQYGQSLTKFCICNDIDKIYIGIATYNFSQIYSNQPTSCCRCVRQQRGLVAITIRGSVLFYSSAKWRPGFHSVKTEFRFIYRVDSIELRTLFYLWKMCFDHHWHWRNT